MEGIGWFTYETVKRISTNHPDVDFYLLFDRPFSEEYIFGRNVHPIVKGPPSRHPILWYIWFEYSVKKIIKKLKPDLFISPDGYLPLNLDTNQTKTLSIIHDIAYMHYPESVGKSAKWYYQYFFPKFAKQSTRIATVSDYSKTDISNTFNIDLDKIDVLYNGFDSRFEIKSELEIKEIKNKYVNNCDYFIFVGGTYPRKNLNRLIEAFSNWKIKNDSTTKLVIVGKIINDLDILLDNSDNKVRNEILFLGRIDNFDELNSLISGAIGMCYVSIFEGFGIPCLEAMASGTPLIASNVSSIPEVCGNAAYFIDPFDVKSIEMGIKVLASNVNNEREDLIQKGLLQIKKYSWDKTSLNLWASIQKTLNKTIQ